MCLYEGDYGSAIETLVTAISLIKQSKIAQDDRCKILISSLQDTLHGIESKSYSSKLAFDDLFCCTSNRYMVTMFIILCQLNKLSGVLFAECLHRLVAVESHVVRGHLTRNRSAVTATVHAARGSVNTVTVHHTSVRAAVGVTKWNGSVRTTWNARKIAAMSPCPCRPRPQTVTAAMGEARTVTGSATI